MAPFVELRLWLKEAPGTERLITALAVLAVVSLAVAALLPAASSGSSVAAPGAPAAVGELIAGAAEPGVAATDPPASASTPTSAPMSAAGVPAGTTAAAAPGPADAQPRPVPLKATDRGVTAEAIEVGVTMIELGGAQQAGVASSLRTDIEKVIDAYVDAANDAGGVLGRRIVPHKKWVDLVNTNDQRQKCLDFTRTDGVFAVLDMASFLFPATRQCITVENSTVLVTWTPGGADEVRNAGGRQVGLAKDWNRRVRDAVAAAAERGTFDPAKGFERLGILADTCAPYVLDAPNEGLKAYLRAAGVHEWTEFKLGCDIASQQTNAPNAVLQFRQAGVTHVFTATSEVGVGSFAQAAQAQGYKPGYILSDFWNMTLDLSLEDAPAEQFEGALAVSMWHHGDPTKVPAIQACSKILTDRGLPPITKWTFDLEAIVQCENMQLFLHVAQKAGPGLTRASFAAAVQVAGEVRPAMEHLARFDRPGKFTGGDTVAPIRWTAKCRCWEQIGDFRGAYG